MNFLRRQVGSLLWGLCRRGGSADLLLVTNLSGDEELLHGHVMHRWEVLHSVFLATFPPILAEVLLEVDDILGNHDGVLDVCNCPLQALDALLTCVPAAPHGIADAHGLADMHCSVHEVVVDNCIQSPDVVSGKLLNAELLLACFHCGAVVGGEVVPDIACPSLDNEAQVVHLIHTFRAEESGLWGARDPPMLSGVKQLYRLQMLPLKQMGKRRSLRW